MRFSYHESTKRRKPEMGILSGFLAFGISRLCSLTVPTLLLLAMILATGVAWPQAVVKKIDYQGWKDCFEISNPLVRLVIVPQIGGRIMEYSLDGENAFWQNPDEIGKLTGDDVGRTWRNYGGYKAWNAPQSRWHEDNFYDSMPAAVEPLPDQRGVRITTAPITHLGFQFIRDVILSDATSRVRIVERMRNVSDKDIEWSVWEVTQVNVPCWIAFPMKEKSAFPQRWNVLYPRNGPIRQIKVVGNIGIMQYNNLTENWSTDAMGGWMAYMKGQLAYTKHWSTRIVGITYPDGGCDAAFFTCTNKNDRGYAEMEVMGPIFKLKPGEQTELVEDWFLTRLNQSAKDIPDVFERLKLLQKRGLLPRGVKF